MPKTVGVIVPHDHSSPFSLVHLLSPSPDAVQAESRRHHARSACLLTPPRCPTGAPPLAAIVPHRRASSSRPVPPRAGQSRQIKAARPPRTSSRRPEPPRPAQPRPRPGPAQPRPGHPPPRRPRSDPCSSSVATRATTALPWPVQRRHRSEGAASASARPAMALCLELNGPPRRSSSRRSSTRQDPIAFYRDLIAFFRT
jgi:hypothetical protein